MRNYCMKFYGKLIVGTMNTVCVSRKKNREKKEKMESE